MLDTVLLIFFIRFSFGIHFCTAFFIIVIGFFVFNEPISYGTRKVVHFKYEQNTYLELSLKSYHLSFIIIVIDMNESFHSFALIRNILKLDDLRRWLKAACSRFINFRTMSTGQNRVSCTFFECAISQNHHMIPYMNSRRVFDLLQRFVDELRFEITIPALPTNWIEIVLWMHFEHIASVKCHWRCLRRSTNAARHTCY